MSSIRQHIRHTLKQRPFSHRNNLSAHICKSSLGNDGKPAHETAFRPRNTIILNERPWMLPVPEANSVVIGTSAKIEDDPKDQQARYCDDLDGREDEFGLPISTCARLAINHVRYIRRDGPAPHALIASTTTKHIAIQTAVLTDSVLGKCVQFAIQPC